MSESAESQYVRLEVKSADDIDEVVIGFRKDGELLELASLDVPAEATLEKR